MKYLLLSIITIAAGSTALADSRCTDIYKIAMDESLDEKTSHNSCFNEGCHSFEALSTTTSAPTTTAQSVVIDTAVTTSERLSDDSDFNKLKAVYDILRELESNKRGGLRTEKLYQALKENGYRGNIEFMIQDIKFLKNAGKICSYSNKSQYPAFALGIDFLAKWLKNSDEKAYRAQRFGH